MSIMRIIFVLFVTLSAVSKVHAEENYGGEIVSYQTFGEGMMVTRAKVVPLIGTVTNMFFFNRADEPWKGNAWYEYDWEIRGRFPSAGWSQIRVRPDAGESLKDAPVNVATTVALGSELLHYILIRKDNQYIYDIRRDFNIDSYNYNVAGAHDGNSASLLSAGPRTYQTGGTVDHIPVWKELDFSLGITAFDSNWAGRLPAGDYNREAEVDFTRFYTFSGDNLNTIPQWSDEFNGTSLDQGKWYKADWSFSATQFRPENVRVQNGSLYLRINRGESLVNTSSENLALNGIASQSTTSNGGVASRAIDGNVSGEWSDNSTTHTEGNNASWWQVELQQTSNVNQIVIHNRTDSCCVSRLSDYTVSVLDSNNNTVWSQAYSSPPTSAQTINLNATGRTIRIDLNGTLSLAEVEVIGTRDTNENIESENINKNDEVSLPSTDDASTRAIASTPVEDNTGSLESGGGSFSPLFSGILLMIVVIFRRMICVALPRRKNRI